MDKRILIAIAIALAGLSISLYFSLPFSMQLIPATMHGAIPGQMCVFLVSVKGGIGRVRISATAPGSTVTVAPQEITSNQVAEITLIPIEAGNVTITVTGKRSGFQRSKTSTFEVFEGGIVDGEEDPLGALATEIRDKFIPWLAENHPELGITGETEWTGTIVTPRWLVVMHYLFFSEDWEMHVSWHVMIPPHDWARIDLRHRFTEVQPSYAFEISSLDAQEEPHAIDPPESVWR